MERKVTFDNALNATRDQIIADWDAAEGELDAIKNKPVIKSDLELINKIIEVNISIL